MRPVAELLGDLRRAGARVWAEGEDLRYRAPAGSLTPDIIAEMRGRKADLLALFRAADAEAPPIEPAPPEAPLELSPAQQRLWVLDRLHGPDRIYTISLALRLRGRLDLPALRSGLGAILRRHEVLRTAYPMEGDAARPVLVPEGPLPWAEADLSHLPVAESLAEARRRVREAALRPFDLARAPLARFHLWRLDADDHVLLVALHHIAADARSIEVVAEELALLYGAAIEGRDAALPPPPIRHADFARHQRRRLAGPATEVQLAYWCRQLADLPPLLDLPADRPRPPVFSSQGEAYAQPLPPELAGRLRALARRSGTTLYVTLVAAFAALLARYTGRDDVPIACPATHRTRPELDRMVGFLVNTLVLRIDLAESPDFADLLRRARAVVADAFAHQDVPFDAVLQALRVERGAGHPPLAQVSLALLDAERARPRLPGLTTEPFDFGGAIARYDLALEVYEAGDALTVYWIYATAPFEAPTIRRMAGHFRRLLEAVADDPGRALADLPLLDPGESRRITLDWNRTAAPAPFRPVHARFEARAAAAPDAVALALGNRTLTYGALDARANALARRLAAAGIGPDVPVGLCLGRSCELVVGVLAVLKAGGAYLPLDPALPEARLAYMIADSGCRLVLAGGSWRPPAGAVPVIEVGEEADAEAGVLQPSAAGNLAYAIYTSGSTGRPKGCLIEHGSLANYLDWAEKTYHPDGGGAYGLFTSLGFDLTVTSLFLPLIRGRTLRIVPDEVPVDAALRACLGAGSGLDAIKLTPGHIALLPSLGLAGTAVATAVVGGEALLPEQVAILHRLNPLMRVFNEYGPTEATVGCAVKEVRLGEDRVSIGRSIDGARLYVLDRHLRPQPVGVPGELWIGGRGLARGYLNRPDLTAERFREVALPHEPAARLYRSGDLARWTPSGELECLGRTDGQVKVRGFRVELGEVEAALAGHPAVRQAAVLATQGPSGRQLVAHVASPSAPSAGELRAFLAEHLPEYMLPAAFVVRDALPLTVNGKVDRGALARLAPVPAAGDAPVPPRTDAERALAAIWAELLGHDGFGVHDDFFALGGDSILGIQAISRAVRTGLRLTPTDLLRHPTIAGLAAAASDARASPPHAPPRPAASGDRFAAAKLSREELDRVARLMGRARTP